MSYVNILENETEQQGHCVRCWYCCITTDEKIDWKRFYKDFELPLRWQLLKLENPRIHICPFLSADEIGRPACLIHGERPGMCKRTICIWMK